MQLISHLLSLWKDGSTALRKRAVIIVSSLILANIAIWAGGILFAQKNPLFLGLLTLAYGLGLRHAVDADHIAAIDNTTRKLMNDGQRPVGVGLFFSLGHSTIVIILSLLIAISTSFVKENLPAFQAIGGVIGTSVSSIFLIVIGVINLLTFIELFRIFRKVTKGEMSYKEIGHDHVHLGGFLTKLFKPLLRTVHSSPQMYLVGLLFGLGFDTASEVGLLSISAASSASGIPLWGIILLPLAFTAGMALIDTLDGILMLGAYGWATIQPVRKLYYNLNITFISVLVALFIGGVEAIQLLSRHLMLHGRVIRTIDQLNLQSFGYVTVIAFILCWVVSLTLYKLKGYDKLH